MTAKWFGPCRAGLHPEFGWGTPCQGHASEHVSIDNPVYGVTIGDDFAPSESLISLCGDHADLAEQMAGFHYRKPLTARVVSS